MADENPPKPTELVSFAASLAIFSSAKKQSIHLFTWEPVIVDRQEGPRAKFGDGHGSSRTPIVRGEGEPLSQLACAPPVFLRPLEISS